MAIKIYLCNGEIYSKFPWNIPTFSIPRSSKIYPNWDFWFENMPSGNPGSRQISSSDRHTLAPVKLIDNEAIAALVVRLIWGQSYEFTTKPPALCMYSRLDRFLKVHMYVEETIFVFETTRSLVNFYNAAVVTLGLT
jgi:hypothetical protein